ncbi:MAG: phosphoglucomutase [Thermodesulfobacteriota bacterium]
MFSSDTVQELTGRFLAADGPADSDYFGLIKELVRHREACLPAGVERRLWQAEIDRVYELVAEEIAHNPRSPTAPVSFGTSGWRGILGKDLCCRSVCQVTQAIVSLYEDLDASPELAGDLGVKSLAEARARGCVLGYDNRFGGPVLAAAIRDWLTGQGFCVYDAGEASTGTLSAAVLRLAAAFSINLTPSHNPLEYGGFKFNAADAGPAAPSLTNRITARARAMIAAGELRPSLPDPSRVRPCDALALWIELVRANAHRHGLDYDGLLAGFARQHDLVVAVDCVHGASRRHIRQLFGNPASDRLILLRAEADPTFGGIAPEPSAANLEPVHKALASRTERLRLGVIIDPDADRIRFTDGRREITMNHFGAMAYHFLHEHKGKAGMVAKTVATSNFANAIAQAFQEKVFEPRVGFKEFKPVLLEALVCFEESDGITVIGHTPEKDAYIGLMLALDMMLTRNQGLGDYLAELEKAYGAFLPARDAVTVRAAGEELTAKLQGLTAYVPGKTIQVGNKALAIDKVISIDGRKMVLADGSWIMIRPSGTEPKVRFYVEARTEAGKDAMFAAAREMLAATGLL